MTIADQQFLRSAQIIAPDIIDILVAKISLM